jgi:hypothetical protein
MIRNLDFVHAVGLLEGVVYAQSGQKVALPARSRDYILGRAACKDCMEIDRAWEATALRQTAVNRL